MSVAIAAVLAFTGCTSGEDMRPTAREGTNRCTPGPECPVEVTTSDGTTYVLHCAAVPEALVDIELSRDPGRPAIRAIAGVSSTQGVAVLWKDPPGCGRWILGLAEGLSSQTARSIRDEMARGVERFGVTSSPAPVDAPED